MKNFTLISAGILWLLISGETSAQTPVKIWDRFFNGNFTGKDEVRSVLSDASGNVYITGTSYHFFNGGNFSTLKYDSNGTQLWADHYYSAQQGYFNGGKKLVMDKWGNVYAVGTLAINDGDLAIIKYGPNGRLWTINYQPYSFSTYDDFGVDMGVDTSGNFYAIAQVTSPSGNMDDLYIMKCDSSGTKLWDVNYSGASAEDYPRSLAVSKAGNAYPALSTFNFFGTATYDIATIKYTTTGTPDWTSNYNGAGNAVDYPTMINVDDFENTYVCGTADAGATNDMVCYKQNNYGTRLWTVTYNGTASGNDTAVAIRNLPNNLVVVTGSTKELVNGVNKNAIVTMLIDSGTVLWTRKYYGAADIGATPTGMIIDNNGNFVICGYEDTPLVFRNGTILCYDVSGNIVWSDSYDSGAGLADKFNALSADPFGNIFAAGQSFTTGTTDAAYLTVKYGIGGTSSVNEINNNTIALFPNPVSAGETVFIQMKNNFSNEPIQIYTADGRLVRTEIASKGNKAGIPKEFILLPATVFLKR
ncbi:MAG TPA: hypothetical protein PKD91_11735 [Bacteroidia bacterium]|nr:hypothetical protein [Bacteroidia bacterium]